MPRVKPSERCTLVSEQGEKTWFVSLRDSEIIDIMYINMIVAICVIAIVELSSREMGGEDDNDTSSC